MVKGNLIIFNLLLLHRPPRGPAAFNVRGPNRPIKNKHTRPTCNYYPALPEPQVAANEQRLLIHLRIQKEGASLQQSQEGALLPPKHTSQKVADVLRQHSLEVLAVIFPQI